MVCITLRSTVDWCTVGIAVTIMLLQARARLPGAARHGRECSQALHHPARVRQLRRYPGPALTHSPARHHPVLCTTLHAPCACVLFWCPDLLAGCWLGLAIRCWGFRSSVATSLSDGEAIPKNVTKITINAENMYQIQQIKLHTVRPFKFNDVSPHPTPSAHCPTHTLSFVWLERAGRMWYRHDPNKRRGGGEEEVLAMADADDPPQ